MRVISGKYKGRKLITPSDKSVRPLSDRVKEALFNIIDVKGTLFLDLFAGTGNVGIEALSRSAKEVYFLDKSVEIIKKNLELIKPDNAKVLELDFQKSFDYFSKKNIFFDFIFCGPPYRMILLNQIAEQIIDKKILKKGGYLIYEAGEKIELRANLEKYFEKVLERNYGATVIYILKIKRNR